MAVQTLRVAPRPRDYVAVHGRDAVDFLERMLSNDVAPLPVGGSGEALLLTAKARVIAPLVVLRRAEDDLLLLTEPGLGERLRGELVRARFAAKATIELEEHSSTVVLGGDEGIATNDFGEAAVEVLDTEVAGEPVSEHALATLQQPVELGEERRFVAGSKRTGERRYRGTELVAQSCRGIGHG